MYVYNNKHVIWYQMDNYFDCMTLDYWTHSYLTAVNFLILFHRLSCLAGLPIVKYYCYDSDEEFEIYADQVVSAHYDFEQEE